MSDQQRLEPGERILRWFTYQHLPSHLRVISERFAEVAHWCVHALPPGPERTVALRKLLESKDAAVRAELEREETTK